MQRSQLYKELEKISNEPSSVIRSLDLHLGIFVSQHCQSQQDEVLLSTVLVSAAIAQGHVCLPLNKTTELAPSLPTEYHNLVLHSEQALRRSDMIAFPGETAALILDNQQRLYLYRYYQYETSIASDLSQRTATDLTPDYFRAREVLGQLAQRGNLDPGQQHAVALALIKPVLLVSGGPGTGKTYTVAYTLAMIQTLAPKPLRIALAAPTGKAAARMKASIGIAKQSMPAKLANAIPENAQTLHRLLGLRPGADDFTYNQANPLPFDLLVIDEASMIDLAMMDGLIRALPSDCRLILMGDDHQLPSVSAGNIFADLCANGEVCHTTTTIENLRKLIALPDTAIARQSGRIQDAFSRLETNHRQTGTEGLSKFANAIKSGSIANVKQLLADNPGVIDMPYFDARERKPWLQEKIQHTFEKVLNAPSLKQAFDTMETVRFLCAVREGPMGVEGINQLSERQLHKQRQVDTIPEHYRGKPIIIRHNQYSLQLFNGDSGLLWEDHDGQLKAWFRNQDSGFSPVAIARLPAYDTAFAITVHQAQGSEFEQVVLLLPDDNSRVLSRELIYTGVTRARRSLSICCNQEILSNAIATRAIRYSGLSDRLMD